ncbi:hypothetical protein KQ310_05105 [Synechococcus sp. CS-1328]|nr:hypothetical protein [Synechococcus sp. CS-1328]
MLARLEEISRDRPDRVLRLRGVLGEDPLELLVFRGFSSSTTHPTEVDPDQSVLPPGARIEAAELLVGPLRPGAEQVLVGPVPMDQFLDPGCWC